ncbi:hypothetical protein BDZ89DRAFT_1138612 [Hymenopellis radicata]|nr:hypothetical protein BDZ89DRAFT_1138612 [Hymenopellis radicata]
MAYQVLFSQKMVDLDRLAEETKQDFEEASLTSNGARGYKTYVASHWRMQEVLDDDIKNAKSSIPLDPSHIIEKIEAFWTQDDHERERNHREVKHDSYSPPRLTFLRGKGSTRQTKRKRLKAEASQASQDNVPTEPQESSDDSPTDPLLQTSLSS